MKIRNKRWLGKFLSVVLLVIVSFGAVFIFQAPAIDKKLRLAPLANGWVSEQAALQLTSSSPVEAYRKTVSHDLGLGRFRPASFIYTTLSYALSPWFHGRLWERYDKREYVDLITGDLRIASFIFLIVISLAICCMSFLVYFFTGSFFVAIVPIIFISSSPALSGNLLQNYIDSQEISITVAMAFYILTK